MKSIQFAIILDEKRLLGYLNKIAPEKRDQVIDLLNPIMYYSILLASLHFFPSEQHFSIAQELSTNGPEKISAWYKKQSQDLQQAITEALDRLLLSLEAHI